MNEPNQFIPESWTKPQMEHGGRGKIDWGQYGRKPKRVLTGEQKMQRAVFNGIIGAVVFLMALGSILRLLNN